MKTLIREGIQLGKEREMYQRANALLEQALNKYSELSNSKHDPPISPDYLAWIRANIVRLYHRYEVHFVDEEFVQYEIDNEKTMEALVSSSTVGGWAEAYYTYGALYSDLRGINPNYKSIVRRVDNPVQDLHLALKSLKSAEQLYEIALRNDHEVIDREELQNGLQGTFERTTRIYNWFKENNISLK